MENILLMGNGYETMQDHLENLKGGNNMERAIKLNNDTFELSIPEENAGKLTFIFKNAKNAIEKALLLQEVERDLGKAKELYSHGSYIG